MGVKFQLDLGESSDTEKLTCSFHTPGLLCWSLFNARDFLTVHETHRTDCLMLKIRSPRRLVTWEEWGHIEEIKGEKMLSKNTFKNVVSYISWLWCCPHGFPWFWETCA